MKPSDLNPATQRALGLTPKKRKAKKAMTPEQHTAVIQWQIGMRLKLNAAFSSLRLRSNLREHWAVKARRVSMERQHGQAMARRMLITKPCVVTLTRYSPKVLDAHDNLAYAFKPVADGIADWLGGGDGAKSGVKFLYEQAKAPARCFGFVVTWRPMEATP